MLTAPSRAWSVFQQIFAEHWEPFQHAHPRYQTPYDDGLVAKMLACGQPEKMGYVAGCNRSHNSTCKLSSFRTLTWFKTLIICCLNRRPCR
jgi:hypothetical protein